jgi:excisionase family DNA binding protein
MPDLDWTQVQRGKVYTAADAAVLLGRHYRTITRMVESGRLTPLPRQAGEHMRFLGSELLRFLGGQLAPAQGETTAERAGRAKAARDEIKRIAKRRPTAASA